MNSWCILVIANSKISISRSSFCDSFFNTSNCVCWISCVKHIFFLGVLALSLAWICGVDAVVTKGKVGFSPELDETGAFSNKDDCCVLVIGSRQERLVLDGWVQENSVQAEVMEIIPDGNDPAVDPKSVSTSEKRSSVFWDLHEHTKFIIYLHDMKVKEDFEHANRRESSFLCKIQ